MTVIREPGSTIGRATNGQRSDWNAAVNLQYMKRAMPGDFSNALKLAVTLWLSLVEEVTQHD